MTLPPRWLGASRASCPSMCRRWCGSGATSRPVDCAGKAGGVVFDHSCLGYRAGQNQGSSLSFPSDAV
jgi:hypothetical protein